MSEDNLSGTANDTAAAAPSWRPLNGSGKALYAFEPKGDHQIALQVHDVLTIREVSRGNLWYRGENSRDKKVGIFPASYVRLEGTHFAGDSGGYVSLFLCFFFIF